MTTTRTKAQVAKQTAAKKEQKTALKALAATPKAATPKAATPKAATPKAATPKAATPKATRRPAKIAPEPPHLEVQHQTADALQPQKSWEDTPPLNAVGVPQTAVAPAADTPEIAVFTNEHRETCIRVAVGRKNVAFIPFDAHGLHVKRIGAEAFAEEWNLTYPGYAVSAAARTYLLSFAAIHYISEEARTHLEEIAKSGAQSTIIIKENDMTTPTTTAKKPATTAKKATPPASAAKGFDKAKAAADYKASTAKKPAAKASAAKKPAAKASAAKKPAAKASAAKKPAAKPAASAKGKAAKKPAAMRYAGHDIKVLNKDHGAREGTKRQIGMDILINSKTTDEALKEFEKHEGIDASFIRFAVDNGIIKLVASK